jgi:hypothetical protein
VTPAEYTDERRTNPAVTEKVRLTAVEQELRRLRNRQFWFVGIGQLLMLPTLLWMGYITPEIFERLYYAALSAYLLGQAFAGFQRQ